MAEIKKAQAAGFAEDSNAFAGGSSVKGTAAPKKAQQKQSGVHQPRDADDTSGQNVQRSGQAERACEKTRVFSFVLLLIVIIIAILHKKGYSSPYPIRMIL